MANSYTQILVQFVFAVQNRERLINPANREELQQYMTGIVSNRGHKPLAVYCMPDHCHLLVELNPQKSISDLARDVKSGSSKWVNDQRLYYGKFAWQTGNGAFSYARSQLEVVVQYILNQPQHHQQRTFREEYMAILEKFNIQYDARYLFEFF